MELEDAQNGQKDPEEEEQGRRTHVPRFPVSKKTRISEEGKTERSAEQNVAKEEQMNELRFSHAKAAAASQPTVGAGQSL